MPLTVLILGSGSALPTISSNQTSQVVSVGREQFLVDCGEGTQIELRRNKVKIQQINHIFISHLHGDHFFGLVGLLSTMHLLGRKHKLYIFGPKALEEIVKLQFKNAGSYLSFEMDFLTVEKGGQLLFENKQVQITSLTLKHRIPCFGFLFREKTALRKLRVEAIKKYNIPTHARKGITEGKDFKTEDGRTIPNDELSYEPPKPSSYAFCSDTAFNEKLISSIEKVDMLYHETTFLEEDRDKAKKTFHSTAKDAATIASKAGVSKLLMGHFSNRYRSKEAFLEEAKQIFKESYIAKEGEVYEVINPLS